MTSSRGDKWAGFGFEIGLGLVEPLNSGGVGERNLGSWEGEITLDDNDNDNVNVNFNDKGKATHMFGNG